LQITIFNFGVGRFFALIVLVLRIRVRFLCDAKSNLATTRMNGDRTLPSYSVHFKKRQGDQ
jgi:hypothetical protein